ncbi:hypothetical protein PR048_023861 [Dryococelus australis]|uniref:Uncharacterized protein n=1 Tax=Dryococelus australis TaxID=614101 RepID=A0ABQ9GV83_9NEOP|nr:hypothetical protein PR048_023861 [Dryococelus australis]
MSAIYVEEWLCRDLWVVCGQHLTSRKHKERTMNGGRSKQRPAPYRKRGRGGYGMRGMWKGGVKVPKSLQYSQPLCNNFVSSGAML